MSRKTPLAPRHYLYPFKRGRYVRRSTRVRKLLCHETMWCQGVAGYGTDGTALSVNGVMANECVSYSLLGAIYKGYNISASPIIQRVERLIGSRDIQVWNDAPGRTFAEVRRVVEEAGI